MTRIRPARDPRAAQLMEGIRSRHPRLRQAIPADARLAAQNRDERADFDSTPDLALQVLRLTLVADGFGALMLYRIKARLQSLGVPVLPWIAHRLAIAFSQVSIGDPVVVAPGVYLLHGQVVIDGITEIGPGTVIGPWVTIGLRGGDVNGPTIGADVHIGTGAKVLGGIEVGARAKIGANSVVLHDVPERATVVGAPARPVESAATDHA